MIPSYDSFGKVQWETVDGALKRIVAGEIISGIEDYSPDMLIFNAKQNLGWKQRCTYPDYSFCYHLIPISPSCSRVEELSQQVDQMSARCQEMEEVHTRIFLRTFFISPFSED
jgi:hypothetical protein